MTEHPQFADPAPIPQRGPTHPAAVVAIVLLLINGAALAVFGWLRFAIGIVNGDVDLYGDGTLLRLDLLAAAGCAIHLAAALNRRLASARWAGIGAHLLFGVTNAEVIEDPQWVLAFAGVAALGVLSLLVPWVRAWAPYGERPLGRGAAWTGAIAGALLLLRGAFSVGFDQDSQAIGYVQFFGAIALLAAAYAVYAWPGRVAGAGTVLAALLIGHPLVVLLAHDPISAGSLVAAGVRLAVGVYVAVLIAAVTRSRRGSGAIARRVTEATDTV